MTSAGTTTPQGRAAPPVGAWADLDALVANYGCTLPALNAARERASPELPFPDEIRSYVHEQQHLYHAVATPYGLFTSRLRSLQTWIARDLLIRLPRDHQVRVRVPLLRYIETLPDPVRDALRPLLQQWYFAELLLNADSGSQRAYEHLVGRVPYTKGCTRLSVLKPMQVALAGLRANLAELERSLQPAAEHPEGTLHPHDALPGALAAETVAFSEDAWTEERNLTLLRMFGELTEGLDRLAEVLESGALATEMWNDGETQVRRALTHWKRQGTLPYLLPLAWTRSVVSGTSERRKLVTHVILCDMALCGPVLPEHLPLRRHGLRAEEFFPSQRLSAMLRELPHVAPPVDPMEDPADYGRFTNELCERLGWASPAEIAHACPYGAPLDLREHFYEEAMRWRRWIPWVFTEPQIGVGRPREMEQFLALFSYPIMEFADKTYYHSDKEVLEGFETTYLLGAWCRQLLTGTPREIAVPWSSTPEEVSFLSRRLQALLGGTIGRDTPPPRLVVRPAPPPARHVAA